MRRNVSGQYIGAQMVSATDGSAFTGAVTVYVTGDAGTQAVGSVGSGACTHEGNGFHTYAPAQAETNYTHVAFTFIGSGAVPATVQVFPIAYDANGRSDLGAIGGSAVSTSSAQLGVNVVQAGATAWGSGAITAASVAASALNGKGDWNVGKTGYALTATTGLGNQTADITGSLSGSVGSVTGNVGGNVTGSVGSLAAQAQTDIRTSVGMASANLDTQLGSLSQDSDVQTLITYVDTEVAAIKVSTDKLTFDSDNYVVADSRKISTSAVAADNVEANIGNLDAAISGIPTSTDNADALLKRDWTLVTGEASRSVLNALRFVRNKFSTSASPGYVTIYKEDDSTSAYTKAITTDSDAQPIVVG